MEVYLTGICISVVESEQVIVEILTGTPTSHFKEKVQKHSSSDSEKVQKHSYSDSGEKMQWSNQSLRP